VKIAFSTAGSDLHAPLDPRFGRAPQFLVFDTETDAFELVDNRRAQGAVQGAGTRTVENLVQRGVGCVIGARFGPNAYQALLTAGVRVFRTRAVTIADALELYRVGELTEVTFADISGFGR
jgi:predicted Fe-Mo cluster-binding NifX family protein